MDIYLADTDPLKDQDRFERLLLQMPENRKKKILRMADPANRRLSLGAGILLSKVLSAHGKTEDQTETGPQGKLYLPGEEHFFFNLSHSGSRVMCVAADVPVGCDVQQCYDISEYRKIARRFFSQDETAAMDNVPEEEAKQLFFRYWVLKESYIKASGKGFSTPLNSFGIHFSENGVPVLCGDSDEKTAFLELKLNDGYFYACCLLGKTFIEQFRTEWIDFFRL